MAGFINKSEADITQHRQEYLNSLDLEIQLNKVVEEAVTTQKLTGQPNPITLMKDTRTTTQKLEDYEKLKIQLVKDLEPIADPQFAQMIIQRIVQSPLNVDNRLLIFTAQRIDELVKELKKVYKYGIKGDATDAEHFVNYIYKYYSDKNNIMLGTKALMNRFGASNTNTLGTRLTNVHDELRKILAEIKSMTSNALSVILKIKSRQRALYNSYKLNEKSQNITNVMNDIQNYILKIMYIYPKDAEVIKRIEEASIQSNITDTDYMYFDKYIDFINHNIPTTQFINPLLYHLSTSLKSLVDATNLTGPEWTKLLDNYLSNLISVLNQISGDNTLLTLDNMRMFYEKIISIINRMNSKMLPGTMPKQFPDYSGELKQFPDYDPSLLEPPAHEDPDWMHDVNMGILRGDYIDPERKALLNLTTPINFERKTDDDEQSDSDDESKESTPSRNWDVLTREPVPSRNWDVLTRKPAGTGLSQSNRKIKGSGLDKKEKFKSQIDQTRGIKPEARYIQFGKYYVNKYLLDDNVLSLRTGTGVQIKNFPAYRMSGKLSNVLRRMIGGSNPSYEELNGLTEEEKNYLYRVSKASKILDKVSIPTPSKDQEEKDIHRFNVLKGEIMAGNDGAQVIKEFKVLALKLSKNNIIPKRQINEVLEDLLAMGY